MSARPARSASSPPKPIPQVLQNINAFLLGARSVNPKITCQVIFTGDWSMPVKEAEATNSLVDQGADVVSDACRWPESGGADRRQARHLRVRLSLQPGGPGPRRLSDRPEWNWTDLYPKFVGMQMKGEGHPELLSRRLQGGVIRQSAYGPKVPDAAKKQADEVIAKLTAGGFPDLQRPAEGQQGHRRRRRRRSSGANQFERRETRIHGLPGRGRPWQHRLITWPRRRC